MYNKNMQDNISSLTDLSRSDLKSLNLVETYIKIIGDKSTVCELTMLLAYLRHAILNGEQKDITVKVGSKMKSDFFGFLVNEQEIKDYIAQDFIEIN